MMHDGYGFWGIGWIWWLIFIFFFIIVIWVVVNAISRNSSGIESSRETPLEILEKRYANGEITTEEYRERKKELTGKS